ncbi:hypothetical protein [Leucothrix pacifica]|uniref:Cobalt transporter n=1 Tax=Leucothrix pacifica TaxID=1247513 RepID=A0A317C9G5_9GAMM|nr:hypothetical protein [Leucothrix pacifica]PWQ92702.1 hypothetical protein DKW60_19885 [Leucothrix pacifica]
MKLKSLTIVALLGASLIGSQAYAWKGHHHGKHYHGTHSHHVYVKPVYVKPADNWHQHPANPYTNDLIHNHPNGLNHHVHTYGKGSSKSHTHHGHTYEICPYPGH